MKQKNKRGFFLAEETVKIVLAVIVILFLAGFLFLLYSANSANNNLEIAQKTLKELEKEIKSGKIFFNYLAPKNNFAVKGWILVSFPMQQDSSLTKPNNCKIDSKNCLCICGFKNFNSAINAKGVAKVCEELGTCIESEFKVIQEGGMVLSNGLYITLDGTILFNEIPTKLNINQKTKQITK